MANTKGIIPLAVLLIVAAVLGTASIVTYKSLEPSAKPNPIKSSVKNLEAKLGKPVQTPGNVTFDKVTELDPCPKPHTWSYTLSQQMINDFLEDDMGNVEYAGYKIEGGKVDLGENKLSATLDLNKNRAVYLVLKLDDQGTDFTVEELKNLGSNKLSQMELSAVRLALENADKLVWNYVDNDYKKSFQKVDIHDNSNTLNVFFYTREYLNCINK